MTTMKSHGCQFCEEGDRRPASRIWSRYAAGIGRPSKALTLRRDLIASHAVIAPPAGAPAPPTAF